MTKINPKGIAGRKKRSYSNTPIRVLNEVADAMTEGAEKYGVMNWRDIDINFSDYYNSTLRHMNAWYEGEDFDPDYKSGDISHISKAIAGLIVLRDSMIQGSFIDDRPVQVKK